MQPADKRPVLPQQKAAIRAHKLPPMLLLGLLVLLLPLWVKAAYVFQTVPGQAFDTVSTNVVWTNDPAQTNYPQDDDYQLVNIGFTFYLGETGYNQVRITSNGALHFGADQGFHKDYTNEALPITSFVGGPGFEEAADRVIAGYWDDLEPGTGGTVRYGTLGSAPNRRFVVSFENVPRYAQPFTSYSFQIVLYENGDVRFRYGNDDVNGSSATIGIEVNDTDFTQYSYNTTNAVSDANDILWTREFPALVGATASCTNNSLVTVTFASAISPARANDASNFTISGGVTVNSATYINSTTVELNTSALTSGTIYTLTTSVPTQSVNFQLGSLTTTTFVDQFNTVSYGNNDGSGTFSTNWIETADDGTPTGGNVTISGNQLRLDDRPNSGGQPRIEREVDLTGFTSATLTYDYSTSGNLENSDRLDIAVSNNGGASYTILQTYSNDVSGSASFDISSYISANTRIRFRVQNNYGGNGEFMAIDNVTISGSQITPCAGVDHYLISMASPTVTCESAAVTVTAVDASGNPIDIPGGTTVTMSTDIANNGWTNPGGASSASYTLPADSPSLLWQLFRLTPGTLEVDVDDSNGATDDDGNRNDDFITFVDAGFKFYADGVADNIGLQIAGKSSNVAPGNQTVTLRAIQTDPNTGRCTALINNAAATVNFAYQCSSPATCGITNNGMSINGSQTIDDVTTGYSPITLAFDANGTATLNFDYLDAGQISLQATATLNVGGAGNVTLSGGSNVFTVRPFAWDLQVSGDPYANDAADPVYGAAGNNFNFQIRSVLWQAADDSNNDGLPDPYVDTNGDAIPDSGGDLSDNGTTPNISQIAGSLSLTPTALFITNNNGTLGQSSVNFSSFPGPLSPTPGDLTLAQNWSEAGILQIDASSTNFMGVAGADIIGQRINIGRFIPDHFLLTLNNITPQCGSFSYGGFADGVNAGLDRNGQTFSVSGTITAQNASNGTTQNYAGTFAKLTSAGLNAQAYDTVAAANASGTWNLNASALNFVNGVTSFVDAASHYQFAALSSPLNLRLDLTATDSDSVTSGTVNSNTVEFRLGRLLLQESYGPEYSDLEMRLQSQYYSAGNWIVNTADSCTTYIDSNASFDATSYTDQLNPGETSLFAPVLSQTISNGFSTIGNGLWFSAPGAGNYGSVDVLFDLTAQPWLQFDWNNDNNLDTTRSGLHFGYYRGSDRVIYWREVRN